MLKFLHTYQTLPDDLYQSVIPSSVPAPKLMVFNIALANTLLQSSDNITFTKPSPNTWIQPHTSSNTTSTTSCKTTDKTIGKTTTKITGSESVDATNDAILANITNKQLAEWFSGNCLPDGAQPIAQAYAGHQFGHLNILGDGRAILLGEVQTAESTLLDIQLKGSGRTPYSRGGDGKAALAPMLREYLMSEAMYVLGIPTTRSLAVVGTGEAVMRNYALQGAVLARTASSHLRVGTFVYARLLASQSGNSEVLTDLLDYAVNRHYPQLAELNTAEKALGLLEAVMVNQASLVAHWRRVGFIHGVMNTDNITISGETIDYGPCAFMDAFDENTVFSSIDRQGRYAFKNQVPIMLWNMARFAESLLPLIASADLAALKQAEDLDKQGLDGLDSEGLDAKGSKDSGESIKHKQQAIEQAAISKVTQILDKFDGYYTQTWSTMLCAKLGMQFLADDEQGRLALAEELLQLMQTYKMDYTNTFMQLTLMLKATAKKMLKQASQEVSEEVSEKLDSSIFSDSVFAEQFFEPFSEPKLQDWLARWQQQLLSQWQDNHNELTDELSIKLMQTHNPTVIPRNHLLEEALEDATHGDFSKFKQLLTVLQTPYDWQNMAAIAAYQQPADSAWTKHYQTFCGT